MENSQKVNKLGQFFNRISVYEYQILVMVLLAVILSALKGVKPTEQMIMVVIYFPLGLLFEYATRKAWHYNEVFLTSPLSFSSFSWLNPLGWVGVVLFTTALTNNSFFSFVVWGGLVGNSLEQFFLALGMWTYNKEHWAVTLFTSHALFVYKIPLAVRLGYFIFGGVYWCVNNYLIRAFIWKIWSD